MSHEKQIKEDQLSEFKNTIKEERPSEASQFEEIYNSTGIKTKLDALKKKHFIGISQEEKEESEASCNIKITSEYKTLEVNFNPDFLLHILDEAQIDSSKIEIDQLVHICVALGESAQLAFNNAVTQANLAISQLDAIDSTLKEKLDELRSKHFIGTCQTGKDKHEASCSATMTSQYKTLEVNFNPKFLLHILNEAQIDSSKIETDQLPPICVALGESAQLAFNNAGEKTYKTLEKIINHFMEDMRKKLFSTDTHSTTE